MPVVVLPTGDWTPDTPDYGSSGITVARNVVPLTESSYGPLPAPVALDNVDALPDTPLGVFGFVDRDGTDYVFAGAGNKIYMYKTGATSFTDVSNPERTYAASSFNRWSCTAIQNAIIFSDGVDPIQIYDIDNNATTFVDLSNDAPLAAFMCAVGATGNFLLGANITEGGESIHYPYRVRWGAANNPYYWPEEGSDDAAEVQADFQDLRSDLGHITGVVSGLQNALFAVFLEQGVYWSTYETAPITFAFTQAEGVVGCPYGGSIIAIRGIAYFLGQSGYYAFDGSNVSAIGDQKIDRWFFGDPDDGANPLFLDSIQGAADPAGKLVYWSYASMSSTTGDHDRLLIFHTALGRFAYARASLQWLAKGITTGVSLDQLDQYFSSIDDPAFPSLDDTRWAGGKPLLVGFDADGKLCSFAGDNLAATIETQEGQPGNDRRARVTSARPLISGTSVAPTVALGTRNALQVAPVYGPAIGLNWAGESMQRSDSRYVRARISIPSGAAWQHFQGIELTAAPSTRR